MTEVLISRNPVSGKILKEHNQTPLEQIPFLISKARVAQKQWENTPVKERPAYFYKIKEYVLDNMDTIASLICEENGKPKQEAYLTEIFSVLELITVYSKRVPKILRNCPIPLYFMKNKKSYLEFWPKGVVAIISPWNFPFSIPFGEIVLALLCGNAVLFKPSEVTPLIGLKIFEICEAVGLPKGLLQVVLGDGSRGSELIQCGVDKVFFTGSGSTGKKVMASASQNLTPVVLELGGKDPMIILEDADLDFASSAALWGGFVNSGQACASTERILVQENIHDEFIQKLKEKVTQLRLGEDVGAITFEKQKSVYETHLSELTSQNSKIICGGKFSENKTFLEPTIITNPDGIADCPIEKTKIYNEETFGPVVAVTKFKTVDEAIEKANASRYGLLASIITKDYGLGKKIVSRIQAGSVLINEVLYTHGLSETPWGGVKESGFGVVHSDLGVLEFVNTRHVHLPRSWFPVFKSLWWFPYSTHQLLFFKGFMEVLFRSSWIAKMKALPSFLLELMRMFFKEKRL